MIGPWSTLEIFALSVVGGVFGSMLGLGGGTILIPILTLMLGLDIRYVIGASAVSIIATSSGAAVAYLRDHLTNVRIGMFLELGTTAGAVTGALLAGALDPRWLYLLFGAVLLYSAYSMLRGGSHDRPPAAPPDRISRALRLEGAYLDQALGQAVAYRASRAGLGLAVMYVAGAVAGLLGIGAGVFKVLAMDQVMNLPMKVSSATSNFMIGVTAAASAAIYFARGQIVPSIAAPFTLGVLLGAVLGARWMVRLPGRLLRAAFVPVLVYIGGQMLWQGWRF